jgi:HPt (histidine-containing phosphotransfer) domain-containing protein
VIDDQAATAPAIGAAIGDDAVTSALPEDDLIRDLLGEFVIDARGLGAAVCAAGEAGDRPRVRDLAHRLKGSAATFGFPALADAAGRVEALARAGAGQLGPDLAALTVELARIRAA